MITHGHIFSELSRSLAWIRVGAFAQGPFFTRASGPVRSPLAAVLFCDRARFDRLGGSTCPGVELVVSNIATSAAKLGDYWLAISPWLVMLSTAPLPSPSASIAVPNIEFTLDPLCEV